MKSRGTLSKNKEFQDENCKKTPELSYHLMFVWESFWELSTTRHELGPIPWSAVNDFAYRWGIHSPEEFDSFLFKIRVLDNKFLSIKNKEIDTKKNLSKFKGKSKK